MEAPFKIQSDIKKRIIKPEYKFEYMSKLAGETLTHVFHVNLSVNSFNKLPAIVFVSESKKVFIHCLRIDTDMQEDEDLADIDAIKRYQINLFRFVNMLLDDEIQFEILDKGKLPFINQQVLKEYFDYKINKRKQEEEKYRKEQEYKTYLKLKEKFEEDEWMTNEELFEVFQEAMRELEHSIRQIDNEADRYIINKAIELIDSVAWKYEEDEWNGDKPSRN